MNTDFGYTSAVNMAKNGKTGNQRQIERQKDRQSKLRGLEEVGWTGRAGGISQFTRAADDTSKLIETVY